MQQVTITCDGCGKDISRTGSMPAYRLTLSAEALPSDGHSMYAVAVLPPIDRSHHFCDVECLKIWASKPERERRA